MGCRGVSPRGVPLDVVADYDLSETVKVFLLTSIMNSPPVFISMRRGGEANHQYDFLQFIIDCVQQGVLVAGDVLVLDNASIHNADDIMLPLNTLMQTAQVSICFLPTYSPELNPCEIVFAQCKAHLRYHRCLHHPFWYEIVKGFAQTSTAQMLQYYYKCIWEP